MNPFHGIGERSTGPAQSPREPRDLVETLFQLARRDRRTFCVSRGGQRLQIIFRLRGAEQRPGEAQ